MKYVLDSNVALKWVLPEVYEREAIRLRERFDSGIDQLIAPDVFPIEVAHTLAKVERQGIIEYGSGKGKMMDVFDSMPALPSYYPLLADAFVIASKFRIGVYDCLYVALAKREGCELITADERLVRNLGSTYPFIRPLADFP